MEINFKFSQIDIERIRRENDILEDALSSSFPDIDSLNSAALSAYEDALSSIDCRDCGRCCREILVVFDREDASRLAAAEGEDEAVFIDKHLHYYEAHNVYVLNTSPCPFQKGNICIHYEERGSACREFPYLETKPFSQVYRYLLQGYFICPVICRVVEKIKKHLGITLSEGECGSHS